MNDKTQTVADIVREQDAETRQRAERERERLRKAPAEAQLTTRRIMSEIVAAMKPLFPNTQHIEAAALSTEASRKHFSYVDQGIAVNFLVSASYAGGPPEAEFTVRSQGTLEIRQRVPLARGQDGAETVQSEALVRLVGSAVRKVAARRG
jgi:hypothetical protein